MKTLINNHGESVSVGLDQINDAVVKGFRGILIPKEDNHLRYGGASIRPIVAWFGQYGSGETCIQISDVDGEPIADATIRLTERLRDAHVAVKDYSENEGMVATLIAGGIIRPTHAELIETGFVIVPIYQLSPLAESFV